MCVVMGVVMIVVRVINVMVRNFLIMRCFFLGWCDVWWWIVLVW